jgi:hypothetical protein
MPPPARLSGCGEAGGVIAFVAERTQRAQFIVAAEATPTIVRSAA